jgi:hypothetical protein
MVAARDVLDRACMREPSRRENDITCISVVISLLMYLVHMYFCVQQFDVAVESKGCVCSTQTIASVHLDMID